MSSQIYQFSATIPAGTAQASPVRVNFPMPACVVQGIEWRVPPGPSGLVGFALQNSGITVIPYQSDAFIVTSGDAASWALENQITSGSWQLLGYNTGTFDHTIYVRFLTTPPGEKIDTSQPVTLAAGVSDLSSAGPDNTAMLASLLDAGA